LKLIFKNFHTVFSDNLPEKRRKKEGEGRRKGAVKEIQRNVKQNDIHFVKSFDELHA